MPSLLEETADYQQGYDDAIATDKERIVDAYHSGYRRGYRDSNTDRYGFGWYNGLMIGTLGTLICGWVMHATTYQSKSLEVSFGKR